MNLDLFFQDNSSVYLHLFRWDVRVVGGSIRQASMIILGRSLVQFQLPSLKTPTHALAQWLWFPALFVTTSVPPAFLSLLFPSPLQYAIIVIFLRLPFCILYSFLSKSAKFYCCALPLITTMLTKLYLTLHCVALLNLFCSTILKATSFYSFPAFV